MLVCMYVRTCYCSAVARNYIYDTSNLGGAECSVVACMWVQSVVAAHAR